jgi:hypothetical protein
MFPAAVGQLFFLHGHAIMPPDQLLADERSFFMVMSPWIPISSSAEAERPPPSTIHAAMLKQSSACPSLVCGRSLFSMGLHVMAIVPQIIRGYLAQLQCWLACGSLCECESSLLSSIAAKPAHVERAFKFCCMRSAATLFNCTPAACRQTTCLDEPRRALAFRSSSVAAVQLPAVYSEAEGCHGQQMLLLQAVRRNVRFSLLRRPKQPLALKLEWTCCSNVIAEQACDAVDLQLTQHSRH